MHAILLDPKSPDRALPMSNVRLASKKSYNESWLRNRLFENPTLVPLDTIDPGAGTLLPVVRELRLPKGDTAAFLDILGITCSGRLVLIECKLWRNPQARREVVAQLLEYAALIQQWTYADLTARLVSQKIPGVGGNPLFEIVQKALPDTDEARFVDAVSKGLGRGDFDLVIAGDGIRADVHVLAEYLRERSSVLSRLALVEFQVWEAASGITVVLPSIPFRTVVETQRVVVASDGRPLVLEKASEDDDETVEAVLRPEANERRAANRVFWDGIILRARFDHPDQPPPRHGGDNWIRLDLPPPGRLTLYRVSNGRVGAFVSLRGEQGRAAFEVLQVEKAALEEEVGAPLNFRVESESAPKFTIGTTSSFSASKDKLSSVQVSWLLEAANRFVSAFRPRLARLADAATRSTA